MKKILLIAALLLSAAGAAQAEEGQLGITFDTTYMSKWMTKGTEGYSEEGDLFETIDLDLWGTGAGIAVGHQSATGGHFVDKQRFNYKLYYGGNLFDDQAYQTKYKLNWTYKNYYGKADDAIGGKNMLVAHEVLDSHRIRIIKKDIGGTRGRRIKFDTATNTVQIRYTGQTEEAKRLARIRQEIATRDLRVLIVDDSATVRRLLRKAIESAPDMEVAGEDKDGYEARDLVLSADPDVLTLDIIMPKLDGLSFLKKLQQYYPKQVVIVSTIAKDNLEGAENAIKYGAAEVIDKESLELYKGMDVVREILIPKLRSAARKIPSQTLVY